MPFNTRTHCSESIATQYAPHITRLSILARINKQTTTSSALVSAGLLASGADGYSSVRNQTGEELSEGGGSRGEKGIIFHSDLFSQLVLKVALLFCHRPVFCAPVLFSYKSRPCQFISVLPHVAFLGNSKKRIVQHLLSLLIKKIRAAWSLAPRLQQCQVKFYQTTQKKKIETFF